MFIERANVKPIVTILESIEPLVVIDVNALAKMKAYIDGCSDEIGWLATVEQADKTTYVIKDAFLFKQKVHGATCEITTEGLSEFANELILKPNGVEIWNEIRCWGHSHVNMAVNPSAQDDEQMKIFEECGQDFFIRLIANKKGELELTLYDYKNGMKFKNVKWVTYYENKEVWEKQQEIKRMQEELETLKKPSVDTSYIKDEIKNKVSKITYGNVSVGNKIYGYGNNLYDDVYYSGNWWNHDNSVKKNEITKENILGKTSINISKDDLIDACKTCDYTVLESLYVYEDIVDMAYISLTQLSDVLFEDYGLDLTIQEVTEIKACCLTYVTETLYK